MWELYPYPNITYVNSTAGLFTYANTVTSGLFGMLMLGCAWAIMFILFAQRTSPGKAFSSASTISAILSLILRAGNMIGDLPTILFILMGVAGLLLLAIDRN